MKKVFAKCASVISGNRLLTVGILLVVMFGVGVGVYAKSTNNPQTAVVETQTTTTKQVDNGTTEQTQAPQSTVPSNTASPTNTKPNSQKTASSGGTTPTSAGSSSASASTPTPALTPQPTPQPITGWQVITGTPDQCSTGSEGDKIYCAPGRVATFYISTTRGTTIKKYWEANGLDAGAMSGVTINYSLVSPSELRVQVSSNRTYDPFRVFIQVEVNELAAPQQQGAKGHWFQYKAGCLSTPPLSGCAP